MSLFWPPKQNSRIEKLEYQKQNGGGARKAILHNFLLLPKIVIKINYFIKKKYGFLKKRYHRKLKV